MAIDTSCPFCQKAYKLKDELVGKKVTCANQDCRKAFQVTPVKVTPAANGAAKPPAPGAKAAPAPKAAPKPPPPPVDAEALAAAALADDADAAKAPEDTRTIEMTCAACDTKWTVPWSMQGKNALCPECKTRQKVPEQKKAGKADWRDGAGPVGRKIEKLEGVQATQDVSMISGQTIREAGLIEVEYEPRPFSFYVKILTPVVLGVALVGGLVAWKVRSRHEQKQGQFVLDIIKPIESDEIKNLPPAQVPLYKASLYLLAGQHEARLPQTEHRDNAVRYFGDARAELEKAPRSAERDVLLGELAVAVLALGGDATQVKERIKLPWVPTPPKDSRARIKPNPAEAEGVQGQLRRVFEAMRQEKGPADFDLRAAVARRVARELIKKDEVQMLLDTLQAAFTEAEQPEVRGEIGLELVRAGQKDKAKEVAEGLKTTLSNKAALDAASPKPSAAQALWLAVDPPITSLTIAPAPPPGKGEISEEAGLAYTALRMIQNKPDEAKEIALRVAKPDGKLKALALAAEWADQPGPFVEVAADIATAEDKKPRDVGVLPPGQVLARLAQAAGRAGMPEKSVALIKPMADEGLREWTRAEVLRQQLQANRGLEVKEDVDAPLPADPKKYRIGHAWARFQIARHNGLKAGDRALAQKYTAEWPANTIAPFGQAGVALGVQDAEQK